MKAFPTVSRNTLKKHSMSSVMLAQGCSSGRSLSTMYWRLHSRDSMLATRAINVSLLNPLTPAIALKSLKYLQKVPKHDIIPVDFQ